jgi:hypothetical protein
MDPSKVTPPKAFSNAARPGSTLLHQRTATKQDSAAKGPAGEERRRSQRVLLRVRAKVHVALQGKPATFEVTTLSVNSHGALIALAQNLPTDTRLVLEHDGTKERISCRVVRPPRETSEGFHTAIEFDSADADFWRIAFPPSDWRAEDAEP